jgi:capsular exopolysaccharide synthesis family protein
VTDGGPGHEIRKVPQLPSGDGGRSSFGPLQPAQMTATFGLPDSRGPVRYLQAFREHRLMIVLLCLISLGVAAALTAVTPKKYGASADIQITALPTYGGDSFQGFDLFRQQADGSSPTVAASRVLSSPQYQNSLWQRLGKQGAGVSVSVTPLSQADIVTVSATARSAATAAKAANTYAQVVIEQRKALFQRELQQRMQQISTQIAAIPASGRSTSPTYQQLAGTLGTLRSYVGSGDPTIQILTQATPPAGPSSPRPKLTLIVALLAGLLLGAAAAVGLEVVNPRITREDDLTLSHRLPVLARIPRVSSRIAHGYLAGKALLPPDVWKGYRTLRAVLDTAGPDGTFPRSILVTSASPGDGKTMTAVNLSIALAAAGMRVTLVDADFHRPMVGTIFSVATRRDGLVRLLADPRLNERVTVPSPSHARLQLLLANREQMHQLQLIERGRFERVLQRLESESDVVVIDSPPVPEVAEALTIADTVSTVLVCVRIGHTRRDKLNELRELLGRRGVSPLGFVVTTRERAGASQSEYDYATEITATPVHRPASAVERIRQ